LFCNERCFSIASAKVQLFFETTKFFCNFLSENRKITSKHSKKRCYFMLFPLIFP
jgi:hypothetical protein